MFEFVGNRVGQNSAIDVLEFGVFKGESMEMWLSMNSNPQSRFFGFDSFEGLPETWDKDRKKGLFNTGGVTPQIADPRVRFIKGRFHETLPGFVSSFSCDTPLIVHLDADLYSSTILALFYLNAIIRPHSILVFDEFYDRDHEFRAFIDYIAVFGRTYRVLGEMDNFAKVCIELQ